MAQPSRYGPLPNAPSRANRASTQPQKPQRGASGGNLTHAVSAWGSSAGVVVELDTTMSAGTVAMEA